MYKFKQIYYLVKVQYLSEIHTLRVIMAYLIGLVGILGYCFSYLRYAGPNSVQIFEPFILYFNSSSHLTFSLLGIFLIFCDAPFIDSRSAAVIYRTTKSSWGLSTIIYIIMQTVTYYLVILMVSVGGVLLNAFSGNIWSKPIYTMASYDPVAISSYGLELPDMGLLQNWLPASAMIHSFLLVTLYSAILGILLFVLNLNFHKVIGSITTFLFHFFGYVVVMDSSWGIPMWSSYLGNSILQWHIPGIDNGVTLSQSYLIYLVTILVLWHLLKILMKWSDFKISISSR